MHGLGADASDMQGLSYAPALAALGLHHVFLNAPIRPVTLNAGMKMRAWYDVVGLSLKDKEDREGIIESQAQVSAAIDDQLKAGFSAKQIFLAGFSQGGAMALYTALHSQMPLGGVISLSSYLPLALECKSCLPKTTPIFLALGQMDTIVLPQMTQHTEQWLKSSGYTEVSLRSYPMAHAICNTEINELSQWLSSHLREVD